MNARPNEVIIGFMREGDFEFKNGAVTVHTVSSSLHKVRFERHLSGYRNTYRYAFKAIPGSYVSLGAFRTIDGDTEAVPVFVIPLSEPIHVIPSQVQTTVVPSGTLDVPVRCLTLTDQAMNLYLNNLSEFTINEEVLY
jgi:hypothetical protein